MNSLILSESSFSIEAGNECWEERSQLSVRDRAIKKFALVVIVGLGIAIAAGCGAGAWAALTKAFTLVPMITFPMWEPFATAPVMLVVKWSMVVKAGLFTLAGSTLSWALPWGVYNSCRSFLGDWTHYNEASIANEVSDHVAGWTTLEQLSQSTCYNDHSEGKYTLKTLERYGFISAEDRETLEGYLRSYKNPEEGVEALEMAYQEIHANLSAALPRPDVK